jgi:hypothetical protein
LLAQLVGIDVAAGESVVERAVAPAMLAERG